MRWWDIAELVPIERELFPADPWPAETFWSELAQHPTRYYLVAEVEGELVGYAGLQVVGSQADVQTLAVTPPRQGQGLGARLLAELVAAAGRRGARAVLLEVRAGNEVAQRLYRRAGFERIATRRGYYRSGEDALVLRLRLDRTP